MRLLEWIHYQYHMAGTAAAEKQNEFSYEKLATLHFHFRILGVVALLISFHLVDSMQLFVVAFGCLNICCLPFYMCILHSRNGWSYFQSSNGRISDELLCVY